MFALLTAISLPYLRTHALRLALTLLGVVIGVQGMVAIGALNASIIRSFEAGLDTIAGDATLQIAGPATGIPESLTTEAQTVPGVQSAIAFVQGTLRTVDGPIETVTAFGVDLVEAVGVRNPQFPREHVHIPDELRFLNSTDSVALGTPLLARLHLNVGDSIRLATPAGIQTFTVRGSLDPIGPAKLYAGAIALFDLPTAENLFLAPGLIHNVFVVPHAHESIDDIARRLSEVIGSRARVERTSVRGTQVDAILGSLRVALSLASLVTMIVGFVIIYQTLSLSIEQRRRDIAIARSLGFTRRTIASTFLLESAILGGLGVLGGITTGYVLAHLSLHTVTEGISGVYLAVTAGTVFLPLQDTLVAATLGMATCLIASLVPTLQAAREPPAQILRTIGGVRTETINLAHMALGAAVILVAALVLTIDVRPSTPNLKTGWIMLGHAGLFLGFGLLAPLIVMLWAQLGLRVAARAPLSISLAVDFFSRAPRRAAATASAIMVGYALVVVLGSVVHSMKATLGGWIQHEFGADLTVGVPPALTSGDFDSSLSAMLARVPGVLAVERFRRHPFVYRGNPVVLRAFDRRNRPDHSPLIVVRGQPLIYEPAEAGDAVLISESFAFRYRHDVGDTLELDTTIGTRRFTVSGVVRDYTFDLGTILVDIGAYQRLWKDTHLTSVNVWLAPGADAASVRASVGRLLEAQPLVNVIAQREFRADVDARVDNMLKAFNSLQIFACIIAMLGVVNTLLAAVLDRRREISLLRSVGVARNQIRTAIIVEAGLIGLAGASLGIIEGFVAALYMVRHSMRVATSWSLDFSFPALLAASTAVAVVIAAAIAGFVPARRITREPILAGLQTE